MRKYRDNLSLERLKELFYYSPTQGEFLNNKNKIAGYIDHSGYNKILIDGYPYLAHRLAWLYEYGELPKQDIDHINGNKADNRIKNLRLATGSQNIANSKIHKNNKAGFKGVYFDKHSKKYRSCIRKDGEVYHLGSFKTAIEASEEYILAAKNLFGEYARVN
jgi:hypothetical protein